MTTVGDLIDRAQTALADLAEVGEAVEDELLYVADLTAAWRTRFDQVAEARGEEPAPPGSEAAVERAVDEIGRIEDPHRAIDWLSTFPQVALLAVGERP